jgi:hypothetical protein
MIRGKEFQPIVHRIFGNVRGYLDSEQIQVNCPRCREREMSFQDDGRFNLEINTGLRKFHCWKCDTPKFAGSLGYLIKSYGTKFDYEQYKSYGGEEIVITNNGEEKSIFVELPEEFISFRNMNEFDNNHMDAYKYLLFDRKLSRETILKYNLGFCLEGVYKNRIIIPSYDNNGLLNYFVGRTFIEKVKPPYLNPDVDKDRIIFNEGRINFNSLVFLVEGVFDMFALVNAIPLLGKTISETLFLKLNEIKPNVIIILDPDAIKSGIELFQKLAAIYVGYEDRLRIVELPDNNDIDEVRRKFGVTQLNNYIRNSRQLVVEDFFKFKKYVDGKRKGLSFNRGSKKW